MKTLYHYTILRNAKKIIESKKIKRATLNVPKDEKPICWLSTNTISEDSAYPNHSIETLIEIGYVRFVIRNTKTLKINNWNQLVKKANISPAMQHILTNSAGKYNEWFGTLKDIHLAHVEEVEIMDEHQNWVTVTQSELMDLEDKSETVLSAINTINVNLEDLHRDIGEDSQLLNIQQDLGNSQFPFNKNNNEENTMKKERDIEPLIKTKEYDKETRAMIDEVFEMVTTDCKWHCVDELELEIDEEVEYRFCDSNEYMDIFESVFGYRGGLNVLCSYGRIIYEDDRKIVLIHGHEINIGMMNWMTDFKQFEKLCNTIMGLTASEDGVECIVRDRDFAKETFDMVQNRINKRKAA